MTWFTGLDVNLQAAIIGAVTAVFGILLKDFVSTWWTARRNRIASAEDVYRRYAEPLGDSCTKLFWRLNEMFQGEGHAEYLKAGGAASPFENYKINSTHYRLLALLGWIRAIRREILVLRNKKGKKAERVESAINQFESALADGQHVEIQILEGLSNLWGIPIQAKGTPDRAVAAEVAIEAMRYRHSNQATSAEQLEKESQLTLCRRLSKLISDRYRSSPPSEEVLRECRARAMRVLDVKEAWLYRDWQQAFGDMMLVQDEGANRRYEVIGYYSFEKMVMEPQPHEAIWLRRIARLFDDLDVHSGGPYDARPALLRQIYIATSNLVVCLYESGEKRKVISDKTYRKARSLISNAIEPVYMPTEAAHDLKHLPGYTF